MNHASLALQLPRDLRSIVCLPRQERTATTALVQSSEKRRRPHLLLANLISLHNKLQENHQTQEITTVAHPVSFRRAVSSTAAELRLQTFWHRSIPRSRSSRADAFVTLLRAPPYTEYPILRSPRVGFGQPQLEMAGSDGETSFDTWLVAKLDALGLDAEVCSSSFLPHTHLKFCNHLNHPAAQTKQDARRQVDLPPILSCHVGYFDSFRLCHRSVSSRLSGGTTTTYALRQSVIILATYF